MGSKDPSGVVANGFGGVVNCMWWPPIECRCGRMASAVKIRRTADARLEAVCLDCEGKPTADFPSTAEVKLSELHTLLEKVPPMLEGLGKALMSPFPGEDAAIAQMQSGISWVEKSIKLKLSIQVQLAATKCFSRSTGIIVGRLGELIITQGDLTLAEASCWPLWFLEQVRAGRVSKEQLMGAHRMVEQLAHDIETMLRHLGFSKVGVEVRT